MFLRSSSIFHVYYSLIYFNIKRASYPSICCKTIFIGFEEATNYLTQLYVKKMYYQT